MNSQTRPIFDNEFWSYVKKNLGKDAMSLRLKKKGNENFDIDLAITQIEARNNRLSKKLPTWYNNERIVFPSLLSTEQCSSEATASYKQKLVVGSSLCDLTGGLGIDLYFMAQKVKNATYIEQNELYCHCAQNNFAQLGANHIEVINRNCISFLQESEQFYDTLYIDPARRNKSLDRVYALADCEPNVLEMLPTLINRCSRLIIKLSPMVDISKLRQELNISCHIYIVSLRNECKEILAVIDKEQLGKQLINSNITCTLISSDGTYTEYTFDTEKENELPHYCTNNISGYLYEPDAAILKAGAFKSICQDFSLSKLNKNSHLYYSETHRKDFPGRCFRIAEVLPFSSSLCKGFSKRYKSCNITTRNFPLSAIELRKKLKVADGGDTYLFATTSSQEEHILVICNKIKENGGS